MVLVVSYEEDDHTAAVVSRLRGDGRTVAVLDTSRLGASDSLELEYRTGRPPAMRLHTPDGEVDLLAERAGWWRRLSGFAPDPGISDPSALGFVASELGEVFEGAIAALDLDWINPPAADMRAHHKPLQWALASRLGFDVARTVVTRDPARARAFVDELGLGSVVTKAFLARTDAWRETHVLDADDVERLDQVRYAPTILQEYVPGVDLRVTVVDGVAYAAEIDATGTRLPSDMRMVLDEARVRAVELPSAVADVLGRLMRGLGLVYGAVDLRRTDDGRHVFLEVNPAGLWLFAEERTGLPITAAVAAALATRDDRRADRMRAGAGSGMVVA